MYVLVFGFSVHEWEFKKQKTTGLFDFRFEIQKQKLNYTAFFFHFQFQFHITKINSVVNRNEKTDQKQPFIHILAPEAWHIHRPRTISVSFVLSIFDWKSKIKKGKSDKLFSFLFLNLTQKRKNVCFFIFQF